jgi:hypothetical protein
MGNVTEVVDQEQQKRSSLVRLNKPHRNAGSADSGTWKQSMIGAVARYDHDLNAPPSVHLDVSSPKTMAIIGGAMTVQNFAQN